MNSSTEDAGTNLAGDEGGTAPVAPGDVSGRGIFAGDSGAVPLETRRALVQLLLGPALDGHRHGKLWPVLLRDQDVLRSRLHELFLELVVDVDHEIAFTRQIVAEGLDAPVLLRRAPLTFLQSVLLVFLREQLVRAEARGERAVISLSDAVEHLATFDREENHDRVKFARHARAAVDRAKELNLLRKLRGEDERYEVSPALRLLFPAEEIQALAASYARLPGGADAAANDSSGSDGEEPAS